MTRLEIESQVKAIASDCPFTMPFWLAGMLESECRRQGLKSVKFDGDDFSVEVIIRSASGRSGVANPLAQESHKQLDNPTQAEMVAGTQSE